MPIEFKTLIFPNTETGRQEKIRQLEWYANENWEVISENITSGQIKGVKPCILAAICWPLVFLAGATDGEIIITIRRGRLDTETSYAHNDLSPVHYKDRKISQVQPEQEQISAGELTRKGIEAVKNSQFQQAIQFFDRALERNPQNYNAYMGKLMAVRNAANNNELVRNSINLAVPIEEEELFRKASECATPKQK